MCLRLLFALLTASLSCLLAGCNPSLATVSGEVTLNDQPLQTGTIQYEAAEGDAEPARASIQNGKYELRTVPGKKLVRISAPVVVRQVKESSAPDAAVIDIPEESLPDRFHIKSELTFEVQPGSNTKDWKVEPKVRNR
jgi:hypothetical protein